MKFRYVLLVLILSKAAKLSYPISSAFPNFVRTTLDRDIRIHILALIANSSCVMINLCLYKVCSSGTPGIMQSSHLPPLWDGIKQMTP